VSDSEGQKLAYVYFEDEPGPTLGDEAAYCRCGVDVRDNGTIGARDDGAGLRAGAYFGGSYDLSIRIAALLRECRLFVNEKVTESDVNNVNTSSLEHSSHVDNAA
jgi:hypothetical protein